MFYPPGWCEVSYILSCHCFGLFFKGWIVFVENDEGDVEVICHNDACSTNDSNAPLIVID